MQQQLIVKNKIDSNSRIQATEKIRDQQKNYQITYIITVIHLLLLVTIAIVIRPTIVAKIQSYLDILKIQYMKFSGKA
jgi:hypothetical protein